MRLLLDTHSFLWWVFGDSALSRRANAAIEDNKNEIFVSAASAWEITTKFRLGKLAHAGVVANDVQAAVSGERFQTLAVTFSHAQLAGSLAGKHRDPFDRMLIAQALAEGMHLVTNDAAFAAFTVKRLW